MTTRRTGLVTDEGAPRTLVGTPVAVGDAAPDFYCRVYDPETTRIGGVAWKADLDFNCACCESRPPGRVAADGAFDDAAAA